MTLAERAKPLGHEVTIAGRPNGRHTRHNLGCRCDWGMWGDFDARRAAKYANDHYRRVLAEAEEAAMK